MRIAIAGGTGFIGEKLTKNLLEQGHEILILSRQPKENTQNMTHVQWLQENTSPEKELGHIDVIINLAGVSINKGRWDAKHQKQIFESRMTATDELIRIIDKLPEKPNTFINASAIGIYPASVDKTYTEETKEFANDFLGKTVQAWEEKAAEIQKFGCRVALMRFGVVLGIDGGALPLMVMPYKLFAGGTVGSGKQWLSWVHVEDVVRSISHVIDQPTLSGPINVVAPNPLRMKEFGKTIGKVLHRPHWIPAPTLAMKMVLGKKSALVLEGQQVYPKKLLAHDFEFMYPTLDQALENLLNRTNK